MKNLIIFRVVVASPHHLAVVNLSKAVALRSIVIFAQLEIEISYDYYLNLAIKDNQLNVLHSHINDPKVATGKVVDAVGIVPDEIGNIDSII